MARLYSVRLFFQRSFSAAFRGGPTLVTLCRENEPNKSAQGEHWFCSYPWGTIGASKKKGLAEANPLIYFRKYWLGD
ncbi:MAG: hypothetical protein A2052_05770 [Deltaproteobacteria bacterium GWA2_54_12]|nr:MAG: hypothetical protein A2052_05770 [Deltaproteobacteria bacterium GWA2_54_12]